MEEKKVNISVIGCGRIAETHLDAISKVKRANISIIHDVDESRAKSVADKFRCSYTTSLGDVMKSTDVDAIIICAPPLYHAQIMIKALRNGKHVLCEKPFTTHLEDAIEVEKEARMSNLIVMMASKFRFVDDVIEAKELISSRAIGDVIMAEIVFCSIVDMTNRWNSLKRISGGGVLIDNGSHAVDVIRCLIGPIDSVYAQIGKQAQKIKVEDTARLHFETKDGVIGMVDLSWSLFKHTDHYINIYGTQGTISVGWKSSEYWRSKDGTCKTFGTGYNKLNAFVKQLEHYIDCIQGKTRPQLDEYDAMESVRVIESAYTSIRERRWLRVYDTNKR